MVNFIALLGWNPHSSTSDQLTAVSHQDRASTITNQFSAQELFSMSELVEQFNLEGLNKRPQTVSEKHLLWMNKHHFKRKLRDDGELQRLALRLQKELKQDHNITRK